MPWNVVLGIFVETIKQCLEIRNYDTCDIIVQGLLSIWEVCDEIMSRYLVTDRSCYLDPLC